VFLNPGAITRAVKALIALVGVVGCSGSQLVDTSAVAIPRTYILASYGPAGSSAPFAMIDHMCGTPPVHEQSLMLGDTVTLNADGTSRHAYVMAFLEDGVQTDSVHYVATGTWATFDGTGYAFFDGHTSISVNESTRDVKGNPISFEQDYRLESDGTLAKQAGVGGSCSGSKTPLQFFAAIYKPT
jgi:hypothetical protein